MKTAAAGLVTFLNTARQCTQWDLWTLVLASGTIVRWTDADVDLKTLDARSFTRGPIITRDRVKWVRGIEVDQLKVALANPQVLIDGKALPAFAAAGGFDGAWVFLEHAYLNDAGTMQGSLSWFSGQVADVTPSRMGADLVIKSQLTQLQQMLPRNLYQAGCLNDVYDSNCAANKASFTTTGTVTAVSSSGIQTITGTLAGAAAARFYELGVFKFTSGANNGLSRSVQQQPGAGSSVAFQFARPFPFAVTVGDTFTVRAGCDKTQATCSGKFNNLARFRGQPWIPVPETVT